MPIKQWTSMEWNIRQAGISQMAFILINMFRYRIGLDVKMLNSLKWAPDNIGGKGMPGEYPRRLGASPLRAKALFIMPKYVTTRNILMNVVTEFDRNSRCRFKPSRCRASLYKDVAHMLSRESGTFLNSYARHAMYPASFIIIPCALMAYRAIAQFGSAPALGAGCRRFKSG